MEQTTKICKKCQEEKPLDAFSFLKSKNYWIAQCKVCVCENQKKYSVKNKDLIKAYKRQHYQINKEYISNKSRGYYHQNKVDVLITVGKYRKENGGKIKEYRQSVKDKISKRQYKWRQENKDKIAIQTKQYRYDNGKKLSEYHKEYIKNNLWRQRKKHLDDPLYRLTRNIRSAICAALRNKAYKKTSKTAEILGCDFEGFETWMCSVSKVYPETDTVDIDHVVPVSHAKTETEVLALNHFSNFQWLTQEDNESKGNRFTLEENFQRVLDNHPDPELIRSIVARAVHEIRPAA